MTWLENVQPAPRLTTVFALCYKKLRFKSALEFSIGTSQSTSVLKPCEFERQKAASAVGVYVCQTILSEPAMAK
jgi:hypothetical protein